MLIILSTNLPLWVKTFDRNNLGKKGFVLTQSVTAERHLLHDGSFWGELLYPRLLSGSRDLALNLGTVTTLFSCTLVFLLLPARLRIPKIPNPSKTSPPAGSSQVVNKIVLWGNISRWKNHNILQTFNSAHHQSSSH